MAGWQDAPIVSGGQSTAPAWQSAPVVGPKTVTNQDGSPVQIAPGTSPTDERRAVLASEGLSIPGEHPTEPPPPSDNTTAGSLVANIGAGTNEAVSALAGAPVDLATAGINKGIQGANWVSRQFGGGDVAAPIVAPFGGSQSIRDAQGAVYGGSPDQVSANTEAERIARGAGFGVASALLPGPAVGTLGKLGVISPRAAEIGTMVTGMPSAGNAVLGATAGASGTAAADAVPEPYKPLANLIGGFVGAGTLAALGTGAAAGIRAAGDYLAPVTQKGQQRLAGEAIQAAATDPQAVRAAVADGAQPIVPGSIPTTAQQSGDMGLLSMERSLQTRNPEQFRGRAAEQNQARTGAVRGLETAGDPSDVTRLIRSQLDDIEQSTNAAVNAARTQADTAGVAVGGTQPIEAYGSNIRAAASTAEAAARQRERALWSAVDPDGTLALNVAPVRDAARQIAGDVTPSATPISGVERQIYGAASSYADVMPFKDLTDLRSNLSEQMRNELRTNGRTQSYGRMSKLRGEVEETINTAVERQAQQQSEAVARGEMNPSETAAARLQRDIQEWQDRRAAEARAGQGFGEDAAGNVAFGQGGVSSASGAAGSRQRGSRVPPGDQGVQAPEPLAPNFDEAAAQRLAAASAATRERATTFGFQTPAGAVVRKGETSDAFRLSDAAVPHRVFHPGAKGFEDVSQFRQVVGDENALPILSDYAAMSLRRATARPDGTLDPARIAAWQRGHAEAMRAFPELQQKFSTAAAAETAVADATAARKAALDIFNRQSAARLLNLQDPADVTRTIGGMFSNQNAATTFRELAQATAGSPQARAGVRRAIVDNLMNRFVGNTEVAASGSTAIKSDQLQTFVRQNRPALAQFFTSDEIASLQAVAADLQRANRSLTAARIPGQSNTAQDIAAGQRYGLQDTVLQRLVTSGAGAGAGAMAGGPVGAALGTVGSTVASAMRDAGLRKVDDLVTQAMLDPALARDLLRRVGPNDAPSAFSALAQRLRMIATVTTIGTPRKSRGGR